MKNVPTKKNLRGKVQLTAKTADPHILYENSVQGVESQLDMMARIFRNRRKRNFQTFREDFCGSAQLCCEWVERSLDHQAWGVDLDESTLDWCRANRLGRLGQSAKRICLICDDVLHAKTPPVDVVCAFNFSFNVFKKRTRLLQYFQQAYDALNKEGILFIDEFGGPQSHANTVEKRKVKDGVTPNGDRLQAFTYIWEQVDYNPINHHLTCYIHFKFKDKTRINKAFTYPWRLWTIPELRELLKDAGFKNSEVYLQGWDNKNDAPDGVFRKRVRYDDWESWYGYIAAIK